MVADLNGDLNFPALEYRFCQQEPHCFAATGLFVLKAAPELRRWRMASPILVLKLELPKIPDALASGH